MLVVSLGLATTPHVVTTLRTHDQGLAPLRVANGKAAPVRLQLTDCAASWALAVREVTRVEARKRRHAERERSLPGVARVRCAGSDVVIEVADPSTGARLRRVADLSTSDDKARPRLVALMIAEMLLAVSRDAASPREQAGVRRSAAKETAIAKPAARRGYEPSLGFTVRAHGQKPLWLWGPHIALTLSGVLRPLLLRASALTVRGSRSTALGEVRAWACSGALSVGVQWQGKHLWLDGYVAARLGWTEVRGHPREPAQYGGGSARGAWGGPAVGATVRARLGSSLLLSLAGEAGWSLAAVAGKISDRGRIGLHRGWLAVQVGFGVAL